MNCRHRHPHNAGSEPASPCSILLIDIDLMRLAHASEKRLASHRRSDDRTYPEDGTARARGAAHGDGDNQRGLAKGGCSRG